MADGNATLSSLMGALPGILSDVQQGQGQAAFTRALGSTVVRKVTFRSSFTPDLELQPFAPGDPTAQGAPASPLPGFMGFIKPEIVLDTPLGEQVYAPWGRPTGSFLPHLGGVAALFVAGTALYLGSKVVAKTAGIAALALIGYGFIQSRSHR